MSNPLEEITIGLADWHMYTHTDKRQTGLRQTPHGLGMVIETRDGVAFRIYHDPHGMRLASVGRALDLAEARAAVDEKLAELDSTPDKIIAAWSFDTVPEAQRAGELLTVLQLIAGIDRSKLPDYTRRERFIWRALYLARSINLEAGVRIDPAEPAWPVVFIELPTGQLSWHMPQHTRAWDGHTTEEKHARIQRLAAILQAEEEAA